MTAHRPRIGAKELSEALGQKFPPTEQQARVIEAPLEPLLVVAGAGAGKTETMAARVVWLVANGYVRPEEVLGLTFTRKAAQGLGQRIRGRLETLAGLEDIRDIDPTGELGKVLEVIAPTASTYDSFAGSLVREFGLLLPVEPQARIISQTEFYQIAYRIVSAYEGPMSSDKQLASLTEAVIGLFESIDGHMVDVEEIIDEAVAFEKLFEDLASGEKRKPSESLLGKVAAQRQRLELIPLVVALKQELTERHLLTFNQQMVLAARLAEGRPEVAAALRSRYKVILLDEYQDTSHAQRVLLRSLFQGAPVTAVGDPMQAIYGWRGATSANLERFRTDFAEDGSQAEKMELTTSFRNPPEILELANVVSRAVLGPAGSPTRTVSPLQSFPGAAPGAVHLGYFATREEEVSFVGEQLAQAYHGRDANDPFTAAVLVRKKADSAAMAEELRARGVPVEVLGLDGLLVIPEVADLVAFATMLVRPEDSQAALRILAGPHVGLGVNDLRALADRAANLAGRAREKVEYSSDPREKLQQIIAEQQATEEDSVVGLADAVADLGEPGRYSAEGYRRLSQLASELRYLRTHSLGASLSDLFADIERVTGLRTEVLARQDPHADGAAGTAHLDAFAKHVAEYSQIPGATLSGLLSYLELARSTENGLAPGEVQVRADRVQILTVHAAKGLEWQHVAVLHADAGTYIAKAETWVKQADKIPTVLRGDAREDGDTVGTPVADLSEVEKTSDMNKALEAHIDDLRDYQKEENARLFYVALTRAERQLIVTASMRKPGTKRPVAPYEHLAALREHLATLVPGDMQLSEQNIACWAEAEEGEVKEATPRSASYPVDLTPRGIDLVREAMAQETPLIVDNDLFSQWEKEVSALIEEHHRAQATVVDVELPRELTATDLVALKENPENFARRKRRPVPFKPNTYAKRGTAFHEWLEERAGAQALLDVDELPGIDEELSNEELGQLKEAFLASEWAERTPAFVEHPFEVSIGGTMVRGRMDAVFRNPDDSWLIIDWKTGHVPNKTQLRSVTMQLAVYRYAWAKLQGIDPQDVGAAFYYVMPATLVAPTDLPSGEELVQFFADAVTPEDGVETIKNTAVPGQKPVQGKLGTSISEEEGPATLF